MKAIEINYSTMRRGFLSRHHIIKNKYIKKFCQINNLFFRFLQINVRLKGGLQESLKTRQKLGQIPKRKFPVENEKDQIP